MFISITNKIIFVNVELFTYWNICYEYLIMRSEDKSEEGTLTGTFTLKIHDFLRNSGNWFELKNIKVEDDSKFYNKNKKSRILKILTYI